jgi:DNA-directed RNA polymerase specialized sigma24 family protein
MEDKLYNDIFTKSKSIAFKYINDTNVAEEIAQLTLIQFYLNKEKVDPAKTSNWIFTVTKNFCMDHYKTNNKQSDLTLEMMHYQDINSKAEDFKEDDSTNSQVDIVIDLDKYDFINPKDKKIISKYLYVSSDIKKLSKDFKIKEMTLRNKIRSLLNEIKHFHLIESGIIDFTPIKGTKFNRNISNCLNKLVQALNNNEINTLAGYFKGCKVNESIELIKINRIDTYKVKLGKNGAHKLLIAYYDDSKSFKIFSINFTVNKDNSIHLTELPIFPKSVIAINKEHAFGKEGLKRITNMKGTYNGRLGNSDDFIKNNIGEFHQIGAKIVRKGKDK